MTIELQFGFERRGWGPAVVCLALLLAVTGMVSGQQVEPEGDDVIDWADLPSTSTVPLSETVRKTVASTFLTDEERRRLRVFHGIWEQGDLDGVVADRASAALLTYHLDDPVWDSPDVPTSLRYERLSIIGDYHGILADLPVDGLPDVSTIDTTQELQAARLMVEALHWTGQKDRASRLLSALLPCLGKPAASTSAPYATEAARILILQARIEGFPGSIYQQVVQRLGHIEQRMDRLYWPAKITLGQLLLSKDNRAEAADAFREVLQMNPRCSEAWYGLGTLALGSFNFDAAESAIEELRATNSQHVLADLLSARLALIQDLPEVAQEHLARIERHLPGQRDSLAHAAAALAVGHDIDGMYNALDDFDVLSPGHPYAYYVAGQYLSRARQYDRAAEVLNEAVRRDPTWPAPLIELGLMEFQAGRDREARAALERAQRLDSFNQRATFTLYLIEKLASYHRIESERFAVRFEPGSTDGLLAGEMLSPLERMAADVNGVFDHVPNGKTLIELLPSHEQFAVRITGMPDIHTIAASTGPIIAMESPRLSAATSGAYDWLRVIRHEYVHRVTLSRSDNRMPHWLTEGAAVWQEGSPRKYEACLALIRKMRSRDGLFDLSELNWAFVRPRERGDRSLAYAQSHWMVEYMVEQFGRESLLALLDRYREGDSEYFAMPAALGVSREEFVEGFTDWAALQIKDWGLDPEPALSTILSTVADDPEVRSIFSEPEYASVVSSLVQAHAEQVMQWVLQPTTDAKRRECPSAVPALTPPPDAVPLSVWRELMVTYPDHPDVLFYTVQHQQTEHVPADAMIPVLTAYLAARPVDPMPHRELARLYLETNRDDLAVEHLEALDTMMDRESTFAIELARIYRASQDWDQALKKVGRAIIIEPFNPTFRELAAAIAIQGGHYDAARRQIEALIVLEPNQPQHPRRLEALDRLRQSRGQAPTG
ncbi:MAG: tetratricopeptide repeat protein [Planctomycetes bacterium]|nr:tetratricopeptide repeat protein [Planctomycetota bacterium]